MKTLTLKRMMLTSLLAAAVGGVGCDSTKVAPMGAGGAGGPGGATAPMGGGGAGGPGGGGGAVGGGGAGGAAGAAGIPLVDWVTDLTDNHTNEVSPPDTVADKTIIDTVDPAAFDPLLARK